MKQKSQEITLIEKEKCRSRSDLQETSRRLQTQQAAYDKALEEYNAKRQPTMLK